MTIWQKIFDFVNNLHLGDAFSSIFTHKAERSVTFTIAVIALSAKMAKADGRVDTSEINAFREIFSVPFEEEKNVARIYNLARTDTAGFDAYARQVAHIFHKTPVILTDLLEGLFYIAASDGELHENEIIFLQEVAVIFGLYPETYIRLKDRYDPAVENNPYLVLNINYDASDVQIKEAWRSLVYEAHPDRLISRGAPKEAIALANHRLRHINTAYQEIKSRRQLH